MAYQILIVDDDISILQALALVLKREGYRVVTAVDAEQALDRVRDLQPNLVLSDYMMPGLNGIEFLRRVQSICPYAIRILITAHGDMGVAMKLAQVLS